MGMHVSFHVTSPRCSKGYSKWLDSRCLEYKWLIRIRLLFINCFIYSHKLMLCLEKNLQGSKENRKMEDKSIKDKKTKLCLILGKLSSNSDSPPIILQSKPAKANVEITVFFRPSLT